MKFKVGQRIKMVKPIEILKDYIRPEMDAKVVSANHGKFYTLDIGHMILVAEVVIVEDCFEDAQGFSNEERMKKELIQILGLTPSAGWAEVMTLTRTAVRDAVELKHLREALDQIVIR